MITAKLSPELIYLIENLETSDACSSLCSPLPDFYFSRSVQDGPPGQTCVLALKKKVN